MHRDARDPVEEREWPLVTVVVPMRNEEEHVEACLLSVLDGDYPADRLEVLAVDGRSNDRTREIVASVAAARPAVRLLDNPAAVTPAALNVGIGNAQGSIIIILGAHSKVATDFVSANVHALRTTGADCVGGTVNMLPSGHLAEAISLVMTSRFGIGNAEFRYARTERFVDTVAYGAYRRSVFEELGLFDETMVGNEDSEFNYRILSSGGTVFFTPAIRSWYHPRTDFRRFWRQFFRAGKTKPRVMRRHPRQVSYRHIIPAVFVAALGSGIVLGLAGVSWLPLVAIVGSYGIATIAASVLVARRHGLRHLPLLPSAFTSIHLSYGCGVLSGLWGGLRETRRSIPRLPPESVRNASA